MAASAATPDMDNLSLLFMMRNGLDLKREVDESIPLDDQEGGLMDYRRNSIIVRKKKGKNAFSVRLTFTYEKTIDIEGSFDDIAWCKNTPPSELVEGWLEYMMFSVVPDSAKWEKDNIFYFEVNNDDGKLTKADIISELENESLEDGVYEGGPGDFWIIPASEFK
jgi:hypothetical protein